MSKVIYDCKYPLDKTPIIELNTNSTARGEITIGNEEIEEITSLTATIYKVVPPNSGSDNWQASGSDLYSSSILALSYIKLSTGIIVVKYSFDPSAISGVADGYFYGVTIKVNAADVASTAQAGIELIMKINNKIAEPV